MNNVSLVLIVALVALAPISVLAQTNSPGIAAKYPGAATMNGATIANHPYPAVTQVRRVIPLTSRRIIKRT